MQEARDLDRSRRISGAHSTVVTPIFALAKIMVLFTLLQEARDLDRQLEHARSAAAVAERRR